LGAVLEGITAPLTQAQEYGAITSASITFCTSYFVGSPLLANQKVSPAELRGILADKAVRHVVVEEVPDSASRRDVALAIAADPAWQLVAKAVTIDAIFHDSMVACLLIRPDGSVAPDHAAAEEAVGEK